MVAMSRTRGIFDLIDNIRVFAPHDSVTVVDVHRGSSRYRVPEPPPQSVLTHCSNTYTKRLQERSRWRTLRYTVGGGRQGC